MENMTKKSHQSRARTAGGDGDDEILSMDTNGVEFKKREVRACHGRIRLPFLL